MFYPNQEIAPFDVNGWIKDPTRVTNIMRALTKDKSLADYAFTTGPANNGAVIYDEILGVSDITGAIAGRDVAEIADGAEFPQVSSQMTTPKSDVVKRWGGSDSITRAALIRGNEDQLRSKIIRIGNLVTNTVDRVALAAINAAPVVSSVLEPWAPGKDVVGDLFGSFALVEDAGMGYAIDTAMIHPQDAQKYFLGRKDVREQFPKENTGLNPVLSRSLSGLGDVNWVKSTAVPRGTIYALQREVSGSIRDEEGGLQTNQYFENENHTWVVQAWRSIVPIITDPKSIVKITGFATA
mgnify:CR=1 FL=1